MDLNVAYVRRMISGDDLAFRLHNADWNPDRPAHLLECLSMSLRLLTLEQYVAFHQRCVDGYNTVAETLESLCQHDQNWFDQADHKKHCTEVLGKVVVLIHAILRVVEEV